MTNLASSSSTLHYICFKVIHCVTLLQDVLFFFLVIVRAVVHYIYVALFYPPLFFSPLIYPRLQFLNELSNILEESWNAKVPKVLTLLIVPLTSSGIVVVKVGGRLLICTFALAPGWEVGQGDL